MILALLFFASAALLLAMTIIARIHYSTLIHTRAPQQQHALSSRSTLPTRMIESTLLSVTSNYRPRNGRGDYAFRFQEIARGSFRIYVLDQPPNRSALQTLASPHLIAGDGAASICWTVAITSYKNAKEIAARWAEAMEEFRTTGKGF